MCSARGLFGYAVIASFPALLTHCLRASQFRRTQKCISESPQTVDQSMCSYSSLLELICSLSNALAFPRRLGEAPITFLPLSLSLCLSHSQSEKMKDLIQWRRHGHLNKYSGQYPCRYAVHAHAAPVGSKWLLGIDWQQDREVPLIVIWCQGKMLEIFRQGGLVSIKSLLKTMIRPNDSRGHLPHPTTPQQKIDVYVQYPCFFPTPTLLIS